MALQTSNSSGLLLDFPLGPNQGAGVPAPSDSQGLLWEVLPYNVSVSFGSTYNATIPGLGSGELVSASIGLVLKTENATLTNNANFSPTPVAGNKSTLAADSLEDITNSIDSQGHLTRDFPSLGRGVEYRIFAYHQIPSGYREAPSPEDPGLPAVPQSPVQSYVQDGSFVVDHFSVKGAQVIIDFWEQYLLPNGTLELLQAAGNYGWEDSQEFGAGVTVWWTPELLQRFASARAYDLQYCLPLILYDNNGIDGVLPTHTWFVTDEPDAGLSHVNDYRQTVSFFLLHQRSPMKRERF